MSEKNLSFYLASIKDLAISAKIAEDIQVSSLTNNSKLAKPKCIFVAVKGSIHDGHNFIADAVSAGASAIVYKDDPEIFHTGVSYIKIKNSYSAYARLAECYFDYPGKKMKLVGITGTKGKTTSAFLLESIFRENNLSCGLITTVCHDCSGMKIPAAGTTPEGLELQTLFHKMLEGGRTHAVMEVSSHSLHQNRIGTAKFAGVLFTNLSGDHLDYHKDMESYFLAKKILFENHLTPGAAVAINTDDPYGKRLADEMKSECLTFGKGGKCDCILSNIKLSLSGTELELVVRGEKLKIKSCLCGEYNARNIAGVAALASGMGIPISIIHKALEKPISIPGRLERFTAPNDINVFVDYAHTHDSLEQVLKTLRALCKGRLISVFGCGGDRDRTKRPKMGAISAKLADFTIITSDNPRTEDPLRIIEEIKAGIPPGSKYEICPDRRETIKKAIALAKPQDIVLIAGKGHEDYQEIKGVKHHFDDREEVISALTQTFLTF